MLNSSLPFAIIAAFLLAILLLNGPLAEYVPTCGTHKIGFCFQR